MSKISAQFLNIHITRLECPVYDPSVRSDPMCPQQIVLRIRWTALPDIQDRFRTCQTRDVTEFLFCFEQGIIIEGALTFHNSLFVLDSQTFRTCYFFK